MRSASTYSTSPPTGVQAKPAATPGTPASSRTSGWKRSGPRIGSISSKSTRQRPPPAREPLLQPAHAGFSRVRRDDPVQRLVRQLHLHAGKPVRLELLGQEVRARDGRLLLRRVARDLQDLHPVPQRRRNRLQRVRGGDEEDLREIERNLEVVIRERLVLLRIQHLEQGRRG